MTHDAIREPFPGEYDIVLCSLFAHHLDDAQLVALLASMRAAARRLVLVSDLVRSRLTLALVAMASRVVTTSRVVHVDALRSVHAALTPAELAAAFARAGMSGAVIRRTSPARMLARWEVPRA